VRKRERERQGEREGGASLGKILYIKEKPRLPAN
jgi:hypothetical protein